MEIYYMITKIPLTTLDGATIHETNLFKNLKKRKSVIFFVEKANPDFFEDPSIIEIPNIRLKVFSQLTFQFFLFFTLIKFYRNKQLRPKGIYIRYGASQIASILFSKIFKIPCITVVNGIPEIELKLNPKFNFPLFLLAVKMHQIWVYKNVKRVVAVSSGIKEHIKKNYPISSKKIIVIENGANVDLFKPMNQTECKRKIGIGENELDYQLVGFTGSLTRWQGLEFLILAAPLIIKKRKKIKFLIVGEGEMKHYLMNLSKTLGLERYFVFSGQVPYSEVPLYINACDIMVAPRRDLQVRSSPLKTYEYLACEKLIVASRVPYHEFIETNQYGVLVKPDDPKELAFGILNLLDMSQEERKKMGRNARNYVCDGHSWKSVSLKVLRVLNL